MSAMLASSFVYSPFSIPIFAFVSAGATISICVIAIQWRKARVAAYSARLKQVMIDRGMTADEIVAVMQAGNPTRERDCWGGRRQVI